MPITSLWESILLFVAAAAAGAVNSVAGGGTLLTFPALLAAGYLHKTANATSTVALWPGQASSLWGLRREVRESLQGRISSVWQLLAIGAAGGIVGATLFTRTDETVFRFLVPYLILVAVILFLLQEPLSRRLKAREGVAGEPDAGDSLRMTVPVALFLFGIAVYGGYFGAGIGILTLAALGMLGMRDIHRMNGVKAVFTLAVNGVTVVMFSFGGLVNWRTAGLMALASLIGGYAGADIARRMGQKNVRRIVVLIGLWLAGKLFWDAYGGWFLQVVGRLARTLNPG